MVLFHPQIMSEMRLVTVASAQSWLRGEIDDDGLKAGGEVIYWAELPALREYRAGLSQIAEFKRRGVRMMILRGCHAAVNHKLRHEKAIECLSEPRNYRGQEVRAVRWLVMPDAFEHWTEKFL